MMNQKTIAKIANVSTATISRVINNYEGVSEKTKQKVLAVLEENNYVQNISAKNLRRANSKTIGFLISKFSDPFFLLVYEGMESVCQSRGYHVLILNTNEDIKQESKAIDLMLGYRVEGIVASFVNPSQKVLNQLKSLKTNVLMLDRKIDGLEADMITIDNIGGAKTQVSYLRELGHKEIAVIHGTTTNSTGKERLDGYYQGMGEAGLSIDESYVVCGEFVEDAAYSAMIKLMSFSKRPTAVAVHNNLMCSGAYKALMDLKIKIPDDVSLIGFDDFDVVSNDLLDMGAYMGPGITLIAPPIKEMGILAAETILDRIEGKFTNGFKKVEFPSRMIIRGSCARIY